MIPRTVLPVNQPQPFGVVKTSLRIRGNAVAYLRRTPSTNGDRTKWTFSAWMKRGQLSFAYPRFFNGGLYGTMYASYTTCFFHVNNFLYLDSGQYGVASDWTLQFNAQMVDPASHFHLQIAFDSTQAIASNRVIVYINGVAVPYGSGTYPALNYATLMNTAAYEMSVGACNGGAQFDGVMSDVYFIDGQALAPTYFGATDAPTNMWSPKKYTGTFGTNGFHLDFKDTSSLTTSSNVGIGKDTSGNGNYLVTTSIATTDASTDVPFPVDARTANYCVLNPLVPGLANAPVAANLAIANGVAYGTFNVKTGKWYFESAASAGVTDTYMGMSPFYFRADGTRYNGTTWVAYAAAYTSEIIGCEADLINGTIEFFKGGVSQGKITGLSYPATGSVPAFYAASGYYVLANFGALPWQKPPNSGFVALNSFNLAAPLISKPNQHFDAVTYTGNGSTQNIVLPGGFKPDLLMYKCRSVAYNHGEFDSLRGATKYMASNLYDAEVTYSDTVTSFNSNGWSLGANVNPNNNISTYVGWAWKCGGAGVANTVGTISSIVSVNAAAGVSILTYTGTGANGTVGHGLGVAPGLVIAKARGAATSWQVLHSSMTPDSIMYLDQQSASAADTTKWNNVAPNSTVFNVGSSAGTNANATSFVAYCFTAVPGFSAIGTYTGNSAADGPLVTLDFKPRFILLKNKSRTSNWLMFDTARSPFNAGTQQEVDANLVNVEAASPNFDILSNGFKCRDAGGGATNYNGDTYIYAAFAESPFKYSLAR